MSPTPPVPPPPSPEQRIEALTAELQQAHRELESFAYSVSHDLRAPLRSIRGFSGALLEECSTQLGEGGREHLIRVAAAADRMERLIGDLLGLSRITGTELARRTVDLSAVARAVAEELQRIDPQRAAAFAIEDGILVEGDPGLLRVAVGNLLGNAWKYTSRNPVANIAFGLADAGGEPWCVVRDDGVGFDPQFAGRLFGVFQRLHGATEFPGSGVGLATVRRILARHGGRVRAEAEPGRGASFFFTLPGIRRAQPRPPQP